MKIPAGQKISRAALSSQAIKGQVQLIGGQTGRRLFVVWRPGRPLLARTDPRSQMRRPGYDYKKENDETQAKGTFTWVLSFPFVW